jgi:hypothetical protein
MANSHKSTPDRVIWKGIFQSLAAEYIKEYSTLVIRKGSPNTQRWSWAEFRPYTLEIVYSPYRAWWRSRVMALAHELGHMLDYYRNYKNVDHYMTEPESLGEWKAYIHGWKVLKKADIPITKREWRRFHSPILTNQERVSS